MYILITILSINIAKKKSYQQCCKHILTTILSTVDLDRTKLDLCIFKCDDLKKKKFNS